MAKHTPGPWTYKRSFLPADTNAPLPNFVLASVLMMRGMWFIQTARQIGNDGRSSPFMHANIRHHLAEIERVLQAVERAEFEAHLAKQVPLSVVKSEGTT